MDVRESPEAGVKPREEEIVVVKKHDEEKDVEQK